LKNSTHIPSLAANLLSRLCKPEFIEEIIGDLHEYQDEINEKPSWKRRVFFWFHVFNFLKPWALKRLGGTQNLNQYGMFKNYFKASARSLKKNALFSGLNMFGLAISMSVGLLMIILITELHSFDRFQEHRERIYRVNSNKMMYAQDLFMGAASFYIGAEVRDKVPGIDDVVIIKGGVDANLLRESGTIHMTGFYATANFFDLFSFDLLRGNPETALSEPNGVVLTETLAAKLFGDEDPLGEALEFESTGGWQNRQVNGIVTGIVADPPKNSHLQFESLLSMATYDQPATGTGWHEDFRTNPRHFQEFQVYLKLAAEAKPEEIEAAMVPLISTYNDNQNTTLTHSLQPMTSFVTSDVFTNRVGPRFSQKQLNIMIGLTIVVLLSACFNYTNLSLARALRRSKEVGVRKVTGATRGQVFAQFLIESVLLSSIALAVAIGLFFIIKPIFLNMPNPSSSGHDMFTLDLRWVHVLYFFGFTFLVGAVAGLLPAAFLSKLKAGVVLQDASKVKLFSSINLRRILTVLQFALSIGLIVCAVLVNKQYQYALNYDLGFNTENVLNVRIHGDYLTKLETEYAQLPEVVGTSRTMMTMGTGNGELAIAQNEDGSKVVSMFWNSVDEKYLDLHEYELIAGSNFLPGNGDPGSMDKIIINEHLVKSLELESPEAAIGTLMHIKGYLRAKVMIVGVVRNFVNTSLDAGGQGEIMAIKDFAFTQRKANHTYGMLAVKYNSQDLPALLQKLEAAYEKFEPVKPFKASFYQDEIARTYEGQKTTFNLVSLLAILAMSIALLGLLGMAVFTTESRMKEISIRKVLGANVRGLMLLLSRGFVAIIVISGLIAIPAAYYVVDQKLLMGFDVRASIGAIDLLSGFLVVLGIGVFTIIWQIRIAAGKNPSEVLRNE